MGKVEFTDEQERAINARGRVIVSASAGSGKTAVMIERLVRLILSGEDVRKVLAVTFTNKAATQMREKLRKAMIQAIATSEGKKKEWLKEQLKALPLADICTIHAFCGRIVRSHFFLADVEPSFRIAGGDDAEIQELCKRAMDEAFENAYEEREEGFFNLLSVYLKKKKDTELRGIILQLHKEFCGLTDFRTRLEGVGKVDEFEDVCAFLAENIRMQAQVIYDEVVELRSFFEQANAQGLQVCEDVLRSAEAIFDAPTYFDMLALEQPTIKSMPRHTAFSGEGKKFHSRLSNASASIKKIYKEVLVGEEKEVERARYLDAQARASAIASLVLRYDDVFTRLKRERGLLDYNDLEHCAVRILKDEEARSAIQEKYKYLFVDEYQDVNLAQEEILSLLGKEEVFLVGDRKQAIYAFRGSRSQYFTDKTKEYETALYLTENFRSASAVLDAVNRVFTRAMTETSCGFDYAPDSVMRGGRRYETHTGSVLFHRLMPKEKEEKASAKGVYSVKRRAQEGASNAQVDEIVRIILSEIGQEWLDVDEEKGKQLKRVNYGDIAVLVRKKSGDASSLVSALSALDIPVATSAKVSISSYWEVKMLLDWLSYLDNPEQDVPRCSAMISRVGGFTEEELAKIRLAYPKAYYFRTACEEYATRMHDPIAVKLQEFSRLTKDLRTTCAVSGAREVLCNLLALGLEAEIASKREGEICLKRVRRLLAEAEGTVREFLYRIQRVGHQIQFTAGSGENAVQVLTMHASKGLEYPVVILGNMNTPFHSETQEVLFSDKFLIAPKSYDLKNKLVYSNVLRQATVLHERAEEGKGELNLLYVAMTRAKYRLHVVFNPEKEKKNYVGVNYLADFFRLDEFEDLSVLAEEESVSLPPKSALAYRPDEALQELHRKSYCAPYPFESSVGVPVKSSASELLRQEQIEGAEREFSPFRDERGGGHTADEGTAYHAFLQHYRFGEGVGSEVERMRAENLLTEEQVAILAEEKLQKIVSMPAIKALAGKHVLREQKFLVSLQWKELFASDARDEVVFQGAIDLLCLEKEGALILDYKFSSLSDERIKKKYATQIALYKKAVARVLKVDENTVRARILNIDLCREIEM